VVAPPSPELKQYEQYLYLAGDATAFGAQIERSPKRE